MQSNGRFGKPLYGGIAGILAAALATGPVIAAEVGHPIDSLIEIIRGDYL
jgi:hypothetical protein